jgi:hypothetical protein
VRGLTVVDLDVVGCDLSDCYRRLLGDLVIKSSHPDMLRGTLQGLLFLVFFEDSRALFI